MMGKFCLVIFNCIIIINFVYVEGVFFVNEMIKNVLEIVNN